MQWVAAVAAGWTLGGLAMWLYFSRMGLIRDRDEWQAHRDRAGKGS